MGAKLPSVETVFCEALEIAAPDERAAFLDRACGGDAGLRRRVESLLDAHDRAGGFLDSPAATPTITTAASRTPEGPGGAVGPYRLLEAIGEGGMGVVYMAEQTAPVRRKVALKLIKPGMDSRQVVARFEAERQALALMDHPNIARVHDAGATESGRPYFVMELVRGLPITEYCDREGLTVTGRLELFVLVCRAVQHAHQKGVIHRDLKPSNVLVTVVDGVPTPKVIDFGIAKATGASLTDRSLYTGFHQLVGTPLYMSPEQADLSSADVDTRSDVYSLGVLLYELLTGSTPFDREAFARAAFDEMRRMIREDEPPAPSTRLSSLGDSLSNVSARRGSDPRRLNRAVRGELDWIAMKALEKDRRRRYETANDLAADVLRYLTDRPVEACPPSAWYRFGKMARRNRGALTTAALVGLALVAGTVASSWEAIQAIRARKETASALVKADARYEQARKAVDEMYTQVAEKWLRSQPSLTSTQRDFLEKALAFYEQFSAETGADPKARREALRALQRVAALRQRLGRNAEAEAAYRQLLARGGDLAARHPDRPEYLLESAVARVGLAALLRDLGAGNEEGVKGVRFEGKGGQDLVFAADAREGRKTEAAALTRQAGLDLATLRDARPPDLDDRRRLAMAHDQLCRELTEARRLPEAEAAARTTLAMWQALAEEYPAEFEFRFQLARAHSLLGMHFLWWGEQDEEAEAALREADRRLARLLGERPRDPDVRNTLSLTLTNLGVVLLRTKRHAEAEAVHRRALSLKEGLAADFPEVPKYREDLASGLNNLAASLAGQGRPPQDQEDLQRRALAVREALVEAHPDVPRYELQMADSLRSLSGLMYQRDEFAKAGELLETALRRADRLRKDHPGLAGADANYGNTLLPLVRTTLALGDADAARRYAREWAEGVLKPFTGDELAEPVSEMCEIQLEAADEASRNLKLSPRKRAAAVQANQLRFAALIDVAARLAPDAPGVLCVLADGLTTAPEALRDPRRAIRFAEKARGIKPDDPLARRSLGAALFRMGDWKGCVEALADLHDDPGPGAWFGAMAHQRLGDEAEARGSFDRADRALARYEASWKAPKYPPPSLLRRIRAEAAALLGLDKVRNGAGPPAPTVEKKPPG